MGKVKTTLTAEELAILDEKITLAKLTYGEIRKVTDRLYISDDKIFDGNTESEQTLFNIFTGIAYEKRIVSKFRDYDYDIFTGKKLSEEKFFYHDNLEKSKYNFLYSLPQYNRGHEIGSFRLYNPLGQQIFIINDLQHTGVRHKEFLINSQYIFIALYFGRKDSFGILYNRQIDKIEDYYRNVVDITKNKELGTLTVIRMNKDNKREAIEYK